LQVTSTTYMDFLLRTSIARLRVVREAREQYEDGGYQQGQDYYRRMREGIVDMHRIGGDSAALWQIVEAAPVRKRTNFEACAKGYEAWMRKRGFIWSRRPASRLWKHGGLSVIVNPELLMRIDDEPHRVKLYFKAPPIKQAGANLVIHLFEAVSPTDAHIAVLDVRRGKMFRKTRSSRDYETVLRSEALSFSAMWQAVGHRAQERPAIS
jgi:hypothetical protein